MGKDAKSKPSPGERADTPIKLSAARLDEITQQLLRLHSKVVGPDVRELVDLVAETAALWETARPPIHASVYDFMPEKAWATMGEHEQSSRAALKTLIKAAGKAEALIKAPADLADADADPFRGAVHRLCGFPFTVNGRAHVEQVVRGIRHLAATPTLLDPSEKRGQRPLTGLAGPVVRASYFYRAKYGLPLTINFVDLDRSGERVGKPSTAEELAPKSSTAILACGVLAAFDILSDPSSVQTHLRKYKAQLAREGRKPLLSDFLQEFV